MSEEKTEEKSSFSPRALTVLVTGIALSFGLFLALVVFGHATGVPYGADADSESAVGYRPFVEFLDRLGISVSVSHWHADRRASEDSLVVIAEPHLRAQTMFDRPREDQGFSDESIVHRRAPTLLVLPKRSPDADPGHEGWVEGAPLAPIADAERVADATGLNLDVVRVDGAAGPFNRGSLRLEPTIAGPAQLLQSHDDLIPVVASTRGILVGRVRSEDPPLYVLSDPDVMVAHGLHRGGNAMLVAELIDQLLPKDGTVLVDAAAQGRGRRPSLASEMFSWPLVLPVATACLAALVAALSGLVRFGAPLPPPRPFGSRARPLVDRAAELLVRARRSPEALRRYLSTSIAEAARAAHMPAGLSADLARAWIDRAAASRGAGGAPRRLADVEAEVSHAVQSGRGQDVLSAARAVHAFRRSLTDGPR